MYSYAKRRNITVAPVALLVASLSLMFIYLISEGASMVRVDLSGAQLVKVVGCDHFLALTLAGEGMWTAEYRM